jgi:hypothetical protein
MWQSKTDAIRREWTEKIQNDRKPTTLGTGNCWQLFRPGAKADLLETRGEGESGQELSSWKSFAKVSFPVENNAPIYFSSSGQRRLHAATVVLEIRKSEPPNSVLRVSSACQVIPDGVSLWPVPALGNDQALAMFKDALPDGERPRVTLVNTWEVDPSNGMGGTRPEDEAAAESLKAVFSKYGVELQTARDRRNGLFVEGMVMPSAWSRYSLPSAFKNFNTPLPTYALGDSVNFSIKSVQQPGDDQAVAKVRINYGECTPICGLVREINSIKYHNGDSAANIMLLPRGRQDIGLEWQAWAEKEAYYRWNVLQGWSLTGTRLTATGAATVSAAPAASATPPLVSSVSGAMAKVPVPNACGDYDSCLRAGSNALNSSDWSGAISAYQAATDQRPTDAEAWEALGKAFLAGGRDQETAGAWDKALSLGGRLSISVCHERPFRPCEKGNLSISAKSIDFPAQSGQDAFSVPPSEVSVKSSSRNSAVGRLAFALQVGKKSYTYYFLPLGVVCQVLFFPQCPPEGSRQQLWVTSYVSRTIPKLASGVSSLAPKN